MRFYDLSVLELEFAMLTENKALSKEYSFAVYFTGHGEFLQKQKRLVWLLSKGNTCKISYEQI